MSSRREKGNATSLKRPEATAREAAASGGRHDRHLLPPCELRKPGSLHSHTPCLGTHSAQRQVCTAAPFQSPALHHTNSLREDEGAGEIQKIMDQARPASTEHEERRAIAVASNAPFSEWKHTLTDQRLCAAVVDRLLPNCSLSG